MKMMTTLLFLTVSATQVTAQVRLPNSNNASQLGDYRNTYSAPAERNNYNSNVVQYTPTHTETARTSTSSYIHTAGAGTAADRPAVYDHINGSYPDRMNDARYSWPGTANAGGGYYSPATTSMSAARYNYAAKRTYPCFTSPETFHKSHRHECDTVHICPPPLPGCYLQNQNIPYFYFADYCNYIYQWYFFDQWLSQPAPTVERKSFNGYLVYGNDTSSGIITMDTREVYLEQPVKPTREYVSAVKYNDKNLKGIVLFAGQRQLHLTKLPGETRLWRVLHAGTLLICDASYNFPSPDNVQHKSLRVVNPTTRKVKKIRSKQQLGEEIRNAYHTTIGTDSWKQMFQAIDALP